MTRYHRDLTIDTSQGYMECPAVFLIDETATLESFRIGRWEGDRQDAVFMSGERHIRDQEAAAFDAWDADQREEALFGLRDDYAAE